jgi:hypothetical protein
MYRTIVNTKSGEKARIFGILRTTKEKIQNRMRYRIQCYRSRDLDP